MARRISPRTRQLVAASLMTLLWTLAAVSVLAGAVTGEASWYFAAAVFFVNGFVPIPFFRYFRALEAGHEQVGATLVGRLATRSKRTLLVVLVSFCLTVAAVTAYVGWTTPSNSWLRLSLVAFLNAVVFFMTLRNAGDEDGGEPV